MSKLQKYRLIEQKPTRIGRMLESLRAVVSGPWSSSLHEGGWWGNQTGLVASGVQVNESTALNYSAVWAAVSLISSQVGNLPLVLYKKDGRSKERYESHPLYRIVHDRPNPEMSAFTFREMLQAHVLLWGNAYAEIERNNAGRVAALWPITPNRVTAFRRGSAHPLEYRVAQPNGGEEIYASGDILHLPGLGFDEYGGYSVVAKARESLGLGIATERFGGSFFGNGATFGGVIAYKGPRPPELSDRNYTEALNQKHQGVDRAHKLLALYNDATYTRLGIPPNDAQFLETRTFQIDEVARWFNLPPHKLKELARSTNNNIEHQNLEYYIDCLAPWLERWEQELCEKLISPLERNQQEIEFVAAGLLRGDTAGRGEFHSKQFNTASITPNEIREVENRNPLKGGDRSFVPLNMIPLDRLDEWLDAEIAAKKPQPVVTQPVDPNAARELAQAIEERDLARKIAHEAEDARDVALDDLRISAEQSTAQHNAALAAAEKAEAAHQVLFERCAVLDADLAVLVAAQPVVQASQIEADVVIVCLRSEIATMTQERDTLAEQARDLRTQQDRLVGERDGLIVGVATVTAERATLAGSLQTADAVAVELRSQIATLATDAETRQAALLEAHAKLVLAQAQIEEREAGRVLADAAALLSETARVQAEKRLAETGIAVRGVVVERLRWLVDREAQRARLAQGSPDKFRRWLEQFYAGHGDLCREILRPSVRAWAVCTEQPEPAEHLLDVLVAELAHSERQLRTVADEHDSETLAPALERILRRWEAERAEAVADRVLKEAA